MSSDATGGGSPDVGDGSDEDFVEFLHELVVDLESKVGELQDQRDADRERIRELEAKTDVFSLVEEADVISAEQRRANLLLHMKKMADKRARNGKKRSYTVTQEQADEALHGPDIDRTTFYTDFRKIEEWVGNKDVCQYISDTGGESRLELDLTRGDVVGDDMPADIANKIRGGA